jgi:DNA-binding transcriptional MocR family regulator
MMQRSKKLTPEEADQVKAAFAARQSPTQVAKNLGLSRRTVHKHYNLLRRNQPMYAKPRPKKPKSIDDRYRYYGPRTTVSDWFIDADGCRTRRVSA